jgi:hypothetical protein
VVINFILFFTFHIQFKCMLLNFNLSIFWGECPLIIFAILFKFYFKEIVKIDLDFLWFFFEIF